jgi:hypothetical protein
MDIPHHLIIEDLNSFALDVDAGRPTTLAMSNISGRMIWDSGAIHEVTWPEFTRPSASMPISIELHTRGPWPPLGTRADWHEVATLHHSSVPRHVVDAVAYWQMQPGPVDQIGQQVMAGLTPQDGPATTDEMSVMTALRRHGWRDQSVPG